MGNVNETEHKNLYKEVRLKLGLSREAASQRTNLSPDKIEKIENEKARPHPDEIIDLAKGYGAPELCNYYCTDVCEIGRQFVPKVEIKDLSKLVLNIVNSLNEIESKEKRLINIAIDDVIDDNEIDDFIEIQKDLEKLSVTLAGLKLLTEQMVASGKIDAKKYQERCKAND